MCGLSFPEIITLIDNFEYEKAVGALTEIDLTRLTIKLRAQVYEQINRIPEESAVQNPLLCVSAARLAYGAGDAARGRFWQNRLILLRDSAGEGSGQRTMLEACVHCTGLAAPGSDNAQILMTLSLLDSELEGETAAPIRLSATCGMPSVLRGAKDLSDWGRNYRTVRRIVRPLIAAVLEENGQGAGEAAVAELLYEKDELSAAAAEASGAVSAQNPEIAFAGLAQLARINRLNPDACPAEEVLRQMESMLETRESDWLAENHRAFAARLDMEAGKLESVREWLDGCEANLENGFAVRDSYLLLTKGKAYLALSLPKEAADLLDQMAAALKKEPRPLDLIECMAHSAIAHELMGEAEPAAERLEQALALALPFGYIRVFADCGMHLHTLMKRCAHDRAPKGPTAKHYFDRIMESAKQFSERYPELFLQELAWSETVPPKDGGETASIGGGLPEKLTQSEIAVLTLVSRGNSNDDIASEMDIKISTVKFHIANIMGKLGAKNRTEAVCLARENGVLSDEPEAAEPPEASEPAVSNAVS